MYIMLVINSFVTVACKFTVHITVDNTSLDYLKPRHSQRNTKVCFTHRRL